MKEGLVQLAVLTKSLHQDLPKLPLDTLPLATREGALLFSIPAITLGTLLLLSLGIRVLRRHKQKVRR